MKSSSDDGAFRILDNDAPETILANIARESGLGDDVKLLVYDDFDVTRVYLTIPDDEELERRRFNPAWLQARRPVVDAILEARKGRPQSVAQDAPSYKVTADPKSRVTWFGKTFSAAWSTLDRARSELMAAGEHIPGYAYLSDEAAMSLMVVTDGMKQPKQLTPDEWRRVRANLALQGATYASWRLSQGIYRFDPWLYAELLATPITGDIPSDLLLRLPAWAIYVETPNHVYDGHELHGFFACIMESVASAVPGPVLQLMFNVRGSENRVECSYVTIPLLGTRTIYQALHEMFAKSQHMLSVLNESLPEDAEAIRSAFSEQMRQTPEERAGILAPELGPLLSLLLYLCCNDPDVSKQPSTPSPTRVKAGLRFFPADKETVVDVGMRIGSVVRGQKTNPQVAEGDSSLTTGRKMPHHVRRGHFHLYWYGPRKSEEREARLLWLHPIIVNAAEDLDAMPTVLHKVVDGHITPQ